MLDLITRMELFIVGLFCLPHLPEDLQPPLPQAPQSASMALSFTTFLFVLDLSPGALRPAEIRPQVHGGTQMFVAGTPEQYAMDLA